MTTMADIKKVEIKVAGMACAGCSGAVEKALSGIDGVKEARVDLAKKTAFVEYDSGRITVEDLKKAIQGAGYKAG
ncbi:MAG: heavy metal-associated domain-containing protein [Methanotrichaceae archaeon]|nr:heavy metal-associated domain-containing protein [Methanotrichaceae archaeon]